MVIYVVTNKINGKQYVGKTVRTLRKRKNQHLRDTRRGSDGKFHRAIRKHGEENFEWKVVYIGETEEELLQKEIELISELDTYKNGYNMTLGGEGISGHNVNFGELSGNASLTEIQVKQIIHLVQNTTMTYPEIADMVGASVNNVRIISTGKGWTHLYSEAPFKNRPDGANVQKRITEKEAKLIVKLIETTNLSSQKIADIVGTSSSNVRQISQGLSWSHLYDVAPNKVRRHRKEVIKFSKTLKIKQHLRSVKKIDLDLIVNLPK